MSGSGGGETLQDFLISINYQINEASQKKTHVGLKQSTYLAVEAGKAFLRLAEEAWRAAHQMAQAMDQLYFASQRTGASIASLNALTYASRQLGAGAQGAATAIESVAKLIATNPAGEGFLNSLGVTTRDANHNLIETGKILENIGGTLKGMPLWKANVVGNMLGIDYPTLLAMRQGLGKFADEYREMQARIHLDSERAGRDSNALGTATRRLGAAFDLIGQKIKAQFTREMAESIERFRTFLVNHFEDIARWIEWAGVKINTFGRQLEQLAGRGMDAIREVRAWFGRLDERTQDLIKTFALLLVGWRLLNTAFMSSPIGRILMLALGLIALYDDYKTWKEGGESLINWQAWEDQVKAAQDLLRRIKTSIREYFDELTKSPDFAALKTAFVELEGSLIGLKNVIINDALPVIKELLKYLWTELVRGLEADKNALEQFGNQFAGMGPKMFSGSMMKDLRDFIGMLKTLIDYLTNVIALYSALASGDWRKALVVSQRILDNMKSGLQDNKQDEESTPRERAGIGEGSAFGVQPDQRNWWQRTMPTWMGGRTASGANPNHPDAGVPVNKQQGALDAFDAWKAAGYSDQAAAVMAAAEERESSHNPASRGDYVNGVATAHGLYQHHGDRRAKILAATGIDISTASAADQRKAVEAEIRLGLDPQSGQVYNKLKNARTFNEAADAEVNGVIRPGDRAGAMQADAAKAATILALAQRRGDPGAAQAAAAPALAQNAPNRQSTAAGSPSSSSPASPPTGEARRPSAPLSFTDWDKPHKALTPEELRGLEQARDMVNSGRKLITSGALQNAVPSLPLASPGATSNIHKQQVLTQDIDININGGSNPEATASAVERAQRRLNQDAVRNMSGALM